MREKDLPQQAPRPHPTLCAVLANGDFDQYWLYHLHREHERIHHARYRETLVLAA